MIQKHADIALQNDQFMVSGDLCFANVMSVYQKSLSLFGQRKELKIDLSQVTSSDSSGLALVIEWIKFAKQGQRRVRIAHLSEDLMSIAEAARLDGVLGDVF